MLKNGWFKIHRKLFTNYDIVRHPVRLATWMHLLNLASIGTLKINRKEFPPGSIVMGSRYLANIVSCSKSSIQKNLIFFENEGMIRCNRGPLGTVITICNWNKYQDKKTSSDHQVTTRGPLSDHPVALNKKEELRSKNTSVEDDFFSWVKDAYPRSVTKTAAKRLAKRPRDEILTAINNMKDGRKEPQFYSSFPKFVDEIDMWLYQKTNKYSINVEPIK